MAGFPHHISPLLLTVCSRGLCLRRLQGIHSAVRISAKPGIQFCVQMAGLWQRTRSIFALPSLVLCLEQFLRFHTALLLIPCHTPLSVSPMQSAHRGPCFYFWSVALLAQHLLPTSPGDPIIPCLLQARAYPVLVCMHEAGMISWAVAQNKGEVLGMLDKVGNQEKTFQTHTKEEGTGLWFLWPLGSGV